MKPGRGDGNGDGVAGATAAARIVLLHAAAPPKPPAGAPCNGCGVCCAAEPCPLAMIVFRRRHGACPALDWQGERYACGLLLAPERHLRWLPRCGRRLAVRFVARWIAAGRGCDSGAPPG